jgi:serine/threonine protein kinase
VTAEYCDRLKREVQIAGRLSDLSNVYPHFVKVYYNETVCGLLPFWSVTKGKKKNAARLEWLADECYVTLMELCDHGGLDSYMKKNALSTRDRKAIFFQVMLAVHVAKKELGARFYDLKPGNFVVQTADSDSGILTFDVNNEKFTLVMDKPVIVKVIDFDRSDIADLRRTSDIEPAITVWHFGTVEFIPTNYLTQPNPTQGDQHDLTSLGLTFLCLVTNDLCIDELVSETKDGEEHIPKNCRKSPRSLKYELKKAYGAKENGFSALRDLVSICNVPHADLVDALYRRLVFFGIDQESTKEGLVWEAIDRVLVKGEGEYQADKKRFDDDRARFGLEEGSDEKLRILREQLAEFPGGTELLKKLCSVDPEKRGTVAEVFEVDFLQSFRER